MARTSNNTGAQSIANPADEVVKTDTPDTGADPKGTDPDPEKEEDKAEKPKDGPAPQASALDGKVKVKHENLKGKKITLPTGEIVAFDENGILEVDAAIAEYLLSIPGYERC
jgi:hypothetical protein